jgi:hypothetical protein
MGRYDQKITKMASLYKKKTLKVIHLILSTKYKISFNKHLTKFCILYISDFF